MGWLVRLAATASEGMEWINGGHEPCCLILDLGLPDGRGEWVLQLARERGLRSFVAVCTGLTDEARVAAVASLQPNVILVKPVKVNDVWNGLCPLIDPLGSTDDIPTMG